MMKPQDIVVIAKLLSYYKKKKSWTQANLAKELCLSPSQVNYSLKRLLAAKLLAPVFSKDNNNETKLVPLLEHVKNF